MRDLLNELGLGADPVAVDDEKLSGEAAVSRLQERRPGALYNEVFASYLREQPAGGGS